MAGYPITEVNAMPLEPLVLALALAAPAAQQPPPRDPPASTRAKPAAPATEEAELERKIQANPSDPANYVALAAAQERRGAEDEAEATWMAAKKAAPTVELLHQITGFYRRAGNFDRAIATLEEAAALAPADPAGPHLIATYYHEKVAKDRALPEAQRWTYVLQGIAAEDRALALKPDYVEALIYKNILLREQANLEADPGQKKVLLAEADALRARAVKLQRAANPRAGQLAAVQPQGPQPACPPRQTNNDDEATAGEAGQVPVRVGGNIAAPKKTRDVPPVYPAEAQEARVEGIVILEVEITPTGEVSAPCVLRSIPMLDQAAIDAVSQWQFTPTLLNGVPVPVIMTVTVNFTLQGG